MNTPYVAGWYIQSDSSLAWRPGRLYIPAMHFAGLAVGAINEGGTGNYAYGQKWEGAGAGTPFAKTISTTGINGVLMNTANTEVAHLMQLPFDFDVSKPMYARIIWTSGSSNTAHTITWALKYQTIQVDVTALGSANTVLDVTIPVDTVVNANVIQATDWGKINGGAIDNKVEYIHWKVILSAFAAGLTADKFFVGLELRYTPKRLVGPTGMMREARAAAYAFARHI